MGTKKSQSNRILTEHIVVYTVALAIMLYPAIYDNGTVVKFAALNGALHWATDWITSRLSGYYYKREQLHNFWCVIGADQLVHTICLVLTASWLLTP